MKKIGIVGFGKLGRFLADKIIAREQSHGDLGLSFVWNRRDEAWKDHPSSSVGLENLEAFAERNWILLSELRTQPFRPSGDKIPPASRLSRWLSNRFSRR